MEDSLIMECLDEEERTLADFVMKCIVLDPSKRMSCEDALKHPFILA
jgi:serine/threonine protein kinase